MRTDDNAAFRHPENDAFAWTFFYLIHQCERGTRSKVHCSKICHAMCNPVKAIRNNFITLYINSA